MRLIICSPSRRRQRGVVKVWIFAVILWLIRVTSADAQFGGSCGCPVIVDDPQVYGRQGDQLQQETLAAQLLQQNTTGGGRWYVAIRSAILELSCDDHESGRRYLLRER